MWMSGRRYAPGALPPGNQPAIHCSGGCVGFRTRLDGCGESSPHPGVQSRYQLIIIIIFITSVIVIINC